MSLSNHPYRKETPPSPDRPASLTERTSEIPRENVGFRDGSPCSNARHIGDNDMETSTNSHAHIQSCNGEAVSNNRKGFVSHNGMHSGTSHPSSTINAPPSYSALLLSQSPAVASLREGSVIIHPPSQSVLLESVLEEEPTGRNRDKASLSVVAAATAAPLVPDTPRHHQRDKEASINSDSSHPRSHSRSSSSAVAEQVASAQSSSSSQHQRKFFSLRSMWPRKGAKKDTSSFTTKGRDDSSSYEIASDVELSSNTLSRSDRDHQVVVNREQQNARCDAGVEGNRDESEASASTTTPTTPGGSNSTTATTPGSSSNSGSINSNSNNNNNNNNPSNSTRRRILMSSNSIERKLREDAEMRRARGQATSPHQQQPPPGQIIDAQLREKERVNRRRREGDSALSRLDNMISRKARMTSLSIKSKEKEARRCGRMQGSSTSGLLGAQPNEQQPQRQPSPRFDNEIEAKLWEQQQQRRQSQPRPLRVQADRSVEAKLLEDRRARGNGARANTTSHAQRDESVGALPPQEQSQQGHLVAGSDAGKKPPPQVANARGEKNWGQQMPQGQGTRRERKRRQQHSQQPDSTMELSNHGGTARARQVHVDRSIEAKLRSDQGQARRPSHKAIQRGSPVQLDKRIEAKVREQQGQRHAVAPGPPRGPPDHSDQSAEALLDGQQELATHSSAPRVQADETIESKLREQQRGSRRERHRSGVVDNNHLHEQRGGHRSSRSLKESAESHSDRPKMQLNEVVEEKLRAEDQRRSSTHSRSSAHSRSRRQSGQAEDSDKKPSATRRRFTNPPELLARKSSGPSLASASDEKQSRLSGHDDYYGPILSACQLEESTSFSFCDDDDQDQRELRESGHDDKSDFVSALELAREDYEQTLLSDCASLAWDGEDDYDEADEALRFELDRIPRMRQQPIRQERGGAYASDSSTSTSDIDAAAGLPVLPGAFFVRGNNSTYDDPSGSEFDDQTSGESEHSDLREVATPLQQSPILQAELHEDVPLVDVDRVVQDDEDSAHDKLSRRMRAAHFSIFLFSVLAVCLLVTTLGTGLGKRESPSQIPGIEGWFQVGQDLFGITDQHNMFFGSAVSISKDGSRVALTAPGTTNAETLKVGSVHIFEQIADGSRVTWEQLTVLEGTEPIENEYMSLTASYDLSHVVVGYPDLNGGQVFHFVETDAEWIQEEVIAPTASDDDGETWFGYAVDLSSDGGILAIGAPLSDYSAGNQTEPRTGLVRLYQQNYEALSQSKWVQLGEDIVGDTADEMLGWSIAIGKPDGLRVAIGSPNRNDGTGAVRVYDWVHGTAEWQQVGQVLMGDDVLNRFGVSVDLCEDGSILAVGEPQTVRERGQVRVFQEMDGTWTQMGQTLVGKDVGEEFGTSVSLADDGLTLAIGGPDSELFGKRSGKIQVLSYDRGLWVQNGSYLGDSSSSGLGFSVDLSGDGERVLGGAPYTTFDGLFVQTGNAHLYETTN